MLYDWRTVAKNIALPLEMLGWDRARRKARVKDMVELVELSGFESHHPWQLSGGMQQRVSIARALSFSPALLLMDEPFGALDEMTRERLNMELLRIWAETGSTVIFVTHSISEAVFLSTRVAVMSARPGRIAAVVPIDLPQPRTFETREAPRYFELVTEVREVLHASGADEIEEPLSTGRRRRMSTATAAPASDLRLGQRIRYWLPAVVVLALALATWQWLLPDGLDVEAYLLPRFSDVVSALWNERAQLAERSVDHLQGSVRRLRDRKRRSHSSSALLLARWRPFGDALMPYMIAANAIPIIAFAPITNAWFGTLSPWSKIAISAVLCYFPVLVNTLRGLTSVNPESIELMRSYAAPQRAVFRRVRIPNSLPFVFTALKVGSVLAMIGAVVGDYFGGSTEALGVVILSSVALSRYEIAWAAILVASILGIAFYAAIAVSSATRCGGIPP